MKKIIKNIWLLSLFFGLIFAFVSNASALSCSSYSLDKCQTAVDNYGDPCEVYQYQCRPKNCYSYNVLENRDQSGQIIDCPSDKCTRDKRKNYCLPLKGVKGLPDGILTCDDYGRFTNYNGGGDLCTTDDLGNTCATPEGENNGACFTSEESNLKTCYDYSYDVCKTKTKDDVGNICKADDTLKKCKIYISQIDINNAASDAASNGEDREAAAEAKKTEEYVEAASKIVPYVTKYTANDFQCSDVKHLTGLWLLIRISAPFIVILFGSLDFFKAMIASDEKKMRESRGRFVKRLIAFFLLIALPFIIQFIFQNIGTYGSQNVCLVKCIVTNNTSSKGCE